MTTKSLKRAICPGTFDPVSYGHLSIIRRALYLFDEVIVAVAKDNAKACLFSTKERVEILRDLLKDEPRVKVDTFSGLLVNYAKEKEATILVRGIRTVADYEYELQMSLANRMLDDKIETIFMMTEGRYSHISSTIVKQVIKLGGNGKEMVPEIVEKRLKEKLSLD